LKEKLFITILHLSIFEKFLHFLEPLFLMPQRIESLPLKEWHMMFPLSIKNYDKIKFLHYTSVDAAEKKIRTSSFRNWRRNNRTANLEI
jgi:hypothetical protein